MSAPDLDYSSPVAFSLRQRVSLAIASFIIVCVMRIMFGTCRLRIERQHFEDEARRSTGCAVLAFWHEVAPLAAWRFRHADYHTLTSYSYDGEMAARVIRRLGIHALRGSSSRGGSDALKRMESAAAQGKTIGLTLDGPRGPRRVAKPGAAILSARTGVSIVPTALAVTRCWRMKSWDRMVIPKPFATIVCAYGPPIPPCASEDESAVEQKRAEIERTLEEAQIELERAVGMPR